MRKIRNNYYKILLIRSTSIGLFLFAVISASAHADEINFDLFMRQNHIDSIQKALSWEDQNIVYEKYEGFSWQGSKDVLVSRKSSCQGFASVNYEILKRLGFAPAVYVFQEKVSLQGPRHALVVFKNGNYFNAISNQCLITSDEVTLQAFIYYLGLSYDLHFPVEYKISGKRRT